MDKEAKRPMAQKNIFTIAFAFLILVSFFSSASVISRAQGLSSGTITGVVVDPNNAVVPNATVTIENAVTGYKRSVNAGTDGAFRFENVPFNNYVYSVSASGFGGVRGGINVRTSVPITLAIPLVVSTATETVTVTSNASESLENVSTAHTDVDQSLITRLPVRSPGSGLSDVVTLAAPGVVADSNGFFHPQGDHAQTSYSIDNQSISDQQSKMFSTQLPPDAVQSLEVITGATPAEYGDKTSLVVNVITKSGLGQKKPTGNFSTTYGTFGTISQNASVGYGSATTVLSVNPYYRLDNVKYLASPNPFSDQTITFGESRRLNNVGVKADLSYVKGKHNAKFGVQISHTFLTEGFQFGITDPDFNDPASPDFLPGLLQFDLTRGGKPFAFHGHTDIKQEALYAQDSLTLGHATLSMGVRFDNYNGITNGRLVQPRLGISYLVKRTGTVLRASFTRNFETPYNENLILSSTTGAGGLANGVLGDTSNLPLLPGKRTQYNVGFQQALGKRIIIDGDYFNKRTNNAYDFNVLFNTSVTFPISWQMSKLDGVSLRVNLTNYKGLTAFMVAGHTRARFFPPESGGLFFNSDLPSGVFRIDHDQNLEQTTQVQYQFQHWKKLLPYVNFTWRYDSGLVAGSVPDFATALGFTADQQAQIGLFCGNTFATPTHPILSCASANRGALRVRIPAYGTMNDDTTPPRIAPRSLVGLSVGTENLLRGEHTTVTLRFTGINITNKIALYNFLSTFSGTHFVTPRAFQVQAGVAF